MANFGLNYLQIAGYSNEGAVVTYAPKIAIPGVTQVGLKLQSVEGKLYADDKLFDYIKEITGGDITLGTAGIPDSAKQLMYGAKTTSRTISGISESPTAGTIYSTNDAGSYVGLSFISKDRKGGKTVYVGVFIPKCLFAPPDTEYKTKGENLEIRAETTTGKLLADDTAEARLIETAVLDTIEDAKKWCDAVITSAA